VKKESQKTRPFSRRNIATTLQAGAICAHALKPETPNEVTTLTVLCAELLCEKIRASEALQPLPRRRKRTTSHD
jgi:hypothetical protein